jgi:hypothetical protein
MGTELFDIGAAEIGGLGDLEEEEKGQMEEGGENGWMRG